LYREPVTYNKISRWIDHDEKMANVPCEHPSLVFLFRVIVSAMLLITHDALNSRAYLLLLRIKIRILVWNLRLLSLFYIT
jgi:hypothetical protein